MQEETLALQVRSGLQAQRWVETFLRLEEYPQTGAPTEYILELKNMSRDSANEFLLWLRQQQEDAAFPFDTTIEKKSQAWLWCVFGVYIGLLAAAPLIALVLCACIPTFGWAIAAAIFVAVAILGLVAGYCSKTTILHMHRKKNDSTIIELTQSKHNTNDVMR